VGNSIDRRTRLYQLQGWRFQTAHWSWRVTDQNPKEAAAAEPEIQQLFKATPNYCQFPDFAPPQKRLAWYMSTTPKILRRPTTLVTKVRKPHPDDPELAKILGEIGYKRKEYPRGIQLLEESVQKQPLDATFLYYLGMSCLQAKQKSQAQ
jgi:predicted Zn-dependent protease